MTCALGDPPFLRGILGSCPFLPVYLRLSCPIHEKGIMMAPASLKGSEHYPASLPASLPNLGKTLRILLLSGGSSSQTMGIALTLAGEMAICPNSGDQAARCPGV